MVHGRYDTSEIWYNGDIVHERYGACEIWYTGDMVHGRYGTLEIWYMGDMVHGLTPQYIADMCKPVSSLEYRSRLRSSRRGDLVVPIHKLTTYGPRAFSIAEPNAWNNLPDGLRDPTLDIGLFRSRLKTHFFNRSYDL